MCLIMEAIQLQTFHKLMVLIMVLEICQVHQRLPILKCRSHIMEITHNNSSSSSSISNNNNNHSNSNHK